MYLLAFHSTPEFLSTPVPGGRLSQNCCRSTISTAVQRRGGLHAANTLRCGSTESKYLLDTFYLHKIRERRVPGRLLTTTQIFTTKHVLLTPGTSCQARKLTNGNASGDHQPAGLCVQGSAHRPCPPPTIAAGSGICISHLRPLDFQTEPEQPPRAYVCRTDSRIIQ